MRIRSMVIKLLPYKWVVEHTLHQLTKDNGGVC